MISTERGNGGAANELPSGAGTSTQTNKSVIMSLRLMQSIPDLTLRKRRAAERQNIITPQIACLAQ